MIIKKGEARTAQSIQSRQDTRSKNLEIRKWKLPPLIYSKEYIAQVGIKGFLKS